MTRCQRPPGPFSQHLRPSGAGRTAFVTSKPEQKVESEPPAHATPQSPGGPRRAQQPRDWLGLRRVPAAACRDGRKAGALWASAEGVLQNQHRQAPPQGRAAVWAHRSFSLGSLPPTEIPSFYPCDYAPCPSQRPLACTPSPDTIWVLPEPRISLLLHLR